MQRTLLTALLILVSLGQNLAQTPTLEPAAPATERYKLRLVLDLKQHSLVGDATIRVRNMTNQPIVSVPVLLYRLMEVGAASDEEGRPLRFTQKVVKFPDEPTWQATAAEIVLPAPLARGKTTTFQMHYGGPLFGYTEVMQYVRDTISEEYSLIRTETMSYPLIAPASHAGIRAVYRHNFYFELETVVPTGYVAVCSGEDSAQPGTESGKSVYRCEGESSGHMITVAVAKFQVFDDTEHRLRVYATPADAEAGKQVADETRRALEFYISYLGARPCYRYGGCSALSPAARKSGFTLIEIPNGWGSYAVGAKIFQAAATFKDMTRANEIYHEIAHIWNAQPGDRIQRSRYFDEGFSTYFEALAVRQFQGDEAFRKFMEITRKRFAELGIKDSRGLTTPIADYGNLELGDFAYSKGAWSLYVLHRLLGDETFRRSIAKFISDYSDKPADFGDLLASMEKSSGRDLQAWFQEWILSADSSDLLQKGATVEQMVARVQAHSPRK